MNTIGAFILVAISFGGNVSSSSYPSLHACEEAKSLAVNGMSIEDEAAYDKQQAAATQCTNPDRVLGCTITGIRVNSAGDISRAACFADVGDGL